MSTISVTQDKSKTFSAYKALDEILRVSKDTGTSQPPLTITLDGYSRSQADAVFSLLGMILSITLGSHVSVPIEKKVNEGKGSAYIVFPRMGSLVSKHNEQTGQTTLSIPLQSLPAFEMDRAVRHSKDILRIAKQSLLPVGDEKYYALACNNQIGVEQQLFTLRPLLAAQGFTAANDIFPAANGLQTDDGQKRPGLVIRKEALDELFKAESLQPQRER